MTTAIGAGTSVARTAILLATSMLAACTVGPNFARPAFTPPPAATAASLRNDLAATTPLRRDWWTTFGDPALDAVEARVLGGNLDIQEAGTRVQRSRAAPRCASPGRTAGSAPVPPLPTCASAPARAAFSA